MKENKPAVILHGHFYQPPRENPWSGKIDRQPGAHPFHDWNERVFRECYRPNAFARITDGHGRVERIVNNYALMSFDFGPTLLSWLEREHPDHLARIVEADRRSVAERGGHGNALAQAYGHAILPLCNERDLRTQIRWGLADFRYRFRREPEGLWLPEAACNPRTLDALIEEGLRFAILSPYQASRVRPLGSPAWGRGGEIDPRVPYAYFHRDGSGRRLAVFFYDGPISHAVAFEGVLFSSKALTDRMAAAGAGGGQAVQIATDGETYGHHFRFGERCVAHTLSVEAPARGFWVTNYGEFLDHVPPAHEVEIHGGPGGEGTAWSCSHGVGRWYRDCGCQTGGAEGWSQAWRTPLRRALDLLRDEAARHFEGARGNYFEDPWAARDAYVSLVLDRSRSREEFLHRFAPHNLSRGEQERALAHLELQRNLLLTYTSCGWFFADVSGIETVQVLSYAARAFDLMDELGLPSPKGPFLEVLSEARSNVPEMGGGADVYRRHVEPHRVTADRVAAHLSIAGLVGPGYAPPECAGHLVQTRDLRKEAHGRLILATGRVLLEAVATGKRADFAILSLHLGGIDFYCALKPYPGEERFRASADRLWKHFYSASLPTMLRIAQEEFGLNEYGLEHVLPDTRQGMIGALFGSLIQRLSDQYALLYQDNERTIEMLHASGFELPPELRSAAEFTLGRQFEEEVRAQARNADPAAYARAAAIAQQVLRRGYQIDRSFSNRLFDDMITEAVGAAIAEPLPGRFGAATALMSLARALGIEPSLERAQEDLYRAVRDGAFPPGAPEGLREVALAVGLSPRALGEGTQAIRRESDSSLVRSALA